MFGDLTVEGISSRMESRQSAARKPPMEWPTSTTPTLGLDFGLVLPAVFSIVRTFSRSLHEFG